MSKAQILYNNSIDIFQHYHPHYQIKYLDEQGQIELGHTILERLNIYNPFAEDSWTVKRCPKAPGNGWRQFSASDLHNKEIRAQLGVSAILQ